MSINCCMCSGDEFNGWMEGRTETLQYGLGYSEEDGTLIFAIEEKDEEPLILGFPINFCPYCGRKIKQSQNPIHSLDGEVYEAQIRDT